MALWTIECADAMGNIMHTLSRNQEEENIYMYRYIAHKNQQYHDDALMGQRSQCFAQFIRICHTCKCCSVPLYLLHVWYMYMFKSSQGSADLLTELEAEWALPKSHTRSSTGRSTAVPE